jgi:hypothetical protein
MIGAVVLGVGVLGAAMFAPAGCGRGGGPSDADRLEEAKKTAADSAAAKGAKFTLKHYAVGDAYSVDLTGMAITDDLLRQVHHTGKVSELLMSRSTVTDDHLGLMHELGLDAFVVKLDLSHTGITDAGLEKMGGGGLVLSEVNLIGTKVTSAGVEAFKKRRQANPSARVKNMTVRLK